MKLLYTGKITFPFNSVDPGLFRNVFLQGMRFLILLSDIFYLKVLEVLVFDLA